MTTTRIRKVPTELPQAHLYLDDIEEICNVLKDAFTEQPARPNPVAPTVKFEVDNNLRMDSIDDLLAHGGSTTRFRIEIGDYGAHLRMTTLLAPEISLYGFDNDQRWKVYGTVRSIFEHRQYTATNLLLGVPEWLVWGGCISGLATLGSLLSGVPWFRSHYYYILPFFALLAFVLFTVVRPSRVSFVRFRERSRLVAQNRKAWIEKIALLIIGGVIGQFLIHFASKLWPNK